jgi:monovalent cation:H+ antiporter, CPA1 family
VSDPDVLDRLRRLPLFAELDRDGLARVAKVASMFEAPANQVLVERGQVGTGMFLLEEGEVVVELPGERIRRGPGEFVGEMALLTERGRRNARVRTETAVRGLAISRVDLDRLLEDEPRIGVGLLRVLATRLAVAEEAEP